MNKFLIIYLAINTIIIHSICQAKIPIETTHLEYSSQALLEVTPTLPNHLTSHNEISFKISNVGSINVSSSILQVNLIGHDKKLLWEGVKTFGDLKPTKEVVAKFNVFLKEIKAGIYKLIGSIYVCGMTPTALSKKLASLFRQGLSC